MGLQIRNARATKVRVITTLIAVFALVAQPLAGFVGQGTANALSSVDNIDGWQKYSSAGSSSQLVVDKSAGVVGNGALKLGTSTNTAYVQYYRDAVTPTPVGGINLSYNSKRLGGPAHAAPAYVLGIDLNGDGNAADEAYAWFEPVYNTASSTQYTKWNTWNVTASSKFWFTGSIQKVNNKSYATLNELLNTYPSAKIIDYTINQGSGNSGWTTMVDEVKTPEATYNFEPVKPETPQNLRLNGNKACGYVTNVNWITPTWDAVTDAVRYNYKVTVPNGAVYGPTDVHNVTSVSGAFGGEGLSQFSVQAVAANGLTSDWAPMCEVTYDKTAPDVSLVSPANDKYLNGASVTQSWTSSSSDIDHFVYESFHDAAATNNVRWSENFGANVTSKTATNVSNATYWWRVTAVDKAGNSTKSELRKITIDNDFPTVAVNANPAEGAHVNGGQVNITGTVNDTNFSYYRYQLLDASKNPVTNSIPGGNAPVMSGVLGTIDLDHMPNQTINAALRGNQLPEGTYYVRVWAQDKATNQTGTKNVPYIATFTLDRTNPDLTVASPTTGWTTEKSQTFSGTTTGDTVEAELDGNPLAVVLNGQQWSADSGVLAVGLHTFAVTTTDTAGNKTSQTVQFEVRDTAPTQGRTLSESPNAPDGPSGLGPNGFTGFLGANNPANNQNDRVAVLGAESQKDAEKDVLGTTATPAVIAPSSEGWKLFGVAWYWWLLVLAVVASLAWWLVGMARRRAEENA